MTRNGILRFTKMHGIGNDYVFMSTFDQAPPADPARLAAVLSDRHSGIGGDGLILIMPSERADARMRMFNADGSEGEMCGNGIRCVAKYLFEHNLSRKQQVAIETGRGVLTLQLAISGGRVEKVRVDMGTPILQADRIPTLLPGNPPVAVPVEVGDRVLAVTAVSMGNPHAVVYSPDVDNFPLEGLGPLLERHSAFPKRVNVHIVQILDRNELRMRSLGTRFRDYPGMRHWRLRRLRRWSSHGTNRPRDFGSLAWWRS